MIFQLSSKSAMKTAIASIQGSSFAVAGTASSPAVAMAARGATRCLSLASGAVSQNTTRVAVPPFMATRGHSRLLSTAAPAQFQTLTAPSQFKPGAEIPSSAAADLARSILRSNNKGGIDWITDSSPESLLDIFTKSFSGSEAAEPEPLMEWAFRGIVPSEFNQDRRDLYRSVLFMGIEKSLQDNTWFSFGHRAGNWESDNVESDLKDSDSDDQALASAVFMRVLDPAVEFEQKGVLANIREDANAFWGLARDRITGKLPAPLRSVRNLATFVSRFPEVKETLKTSHATYGPQETHLFVNLVAMDPDFQGRGFGKQLMIQVAELGDELELPCYLECAGERNPRFYEKFGFRIVHESVFKSDEEGEDGSEYRLFHMTREPQSKKTV